jgi:hypothetical protein
VARAPAPGKGSPGTLAIRLAQDAIEPLHEDLLLRFGQAVEPAGREQRYAFPSISAMEPMGRRLGTAPSDASAAIGVSGCGYADGDDLFT